ncbi:MAG: membrane protein insertase YidC, partial [Pseudomonadota bacterium]
MEKRALLAVILSLLVFFLYQYLSEPDRPTPVDRKTAEREITKPGREKSADLTRKESILREGRAEKPLLKVQEAMEAEEKELVVRTDSYTAIFTTRGAKLKSWRLAKYKDSIGEGAESIELVMADKPEEYPLGLEFSDSTLQSLGDAVFKVDKDSLSLTGRQEQGTVSFSWVSPEGVEVIKTFTFYQGKYLVDLDISILNLSNIQIKKGTSLSWKRKLDPAKDVDRWSFSGPVALVNGELEEVPVKKLDEERIHDGEIKWAGYEDKYFISSIIPSKSGNLRLRMSKSPEDVVSVGITEPTELNRGEKASYRYSLYLGPKDLDILKSVGADLQKAINFGWFDVIAKPLLIFLKYINKFTHNFGVAIILLTVVIKILF